MKRFIRSNSEIMDNVLARMAKDVKMIAKVRVPFKEGDLQEEIVEEKIGHNQHRVLVNKEYAEYQEAGQRSGGSHRVRNYTTPGTGKNFLKDAGGQVAKNSLEYFKQAGQKKKLGL